MFVRYYLRLLMGVLKSVSRFVATLFFTVIAISVATSAQAAETPKEKFDRDIESLFGASVKTRHGEMKVRQSRDQAGRVRKQIVVGPGYSELQLDNDGDGTVDFWEISRGTKTVAASQPNRGRFLRLEVSEKFAKGIQKSTYLLDLNGRSYNLMKTGFSGADIRYQVSGSSFEAKDTVGTVSASSVPTAGSMSSQSRFDLEESDWANFQSTTLGEGIICEAPESAMNRVAALQRDWWKVLKYEVEEKTDRLVDTLKQSKMFDNSCRVAGRAEDFDAMVKGLATVMLSSSKGKPLSSDKTRGRHIRCLEQSGLGITAARMERAFLNGVLDDSKRLYAPIKCDWQEGQSGVSTPAETSMYREQITMRMCLSQDGKGKNLDGASNNYQNVLLHEFMHIAGIEDEAIVHAAQACCGDPTDGRVAACTKLDGLVYKERRFAEIETHLSRVSGEVLPMVAKLEEMFGREDANRIYREYLIQLDDYKRGTGEFPNGLLSDVEFNKCIASSTVSACESKWQDSIEDFTEQFFRKQCVSISSGANKPTCKLVAKDKAGISAGAAVITKSLIDNPNRANASSGTKPGSSTGQPFGSCDPPGTVPVLDQYKLGWYAPTVNKFAKWIFGSDVIAETKSSIDCNAQVGVTSPGGSTANSSGGDGEVPPPGNNGAPAPVRPVDEAGRTANSQGEIADKGIRVISKTTDEVAPVQERPDRQIPNPKTGSSNRPAKSSLAVSPVESDRSKSSLETRYRRATDFVSNASSGLGKVRDAILPAAIASERSSANTTKASNVRLGPRDSFVAFTAERAEKIAIAKIDNPFALSRSIASVDGAASSGVAKGSAVSATSLVVAGGKTAASASSAGENGGAGADGPAGSSAKKASGRTISASGGDVGSVAARSPAGDPKSNGLRESKDDIGDLFLRPYRQIETRLKRLEVIEALVERRISVQDASGRKLGSTRPVDRYVYIGSNLPLKKLKDHE